jgi:hypothetical protein
MGEPTITYTRRPDATQEAELGALARVYAFVIENAQKKGRNPDSEASGPDAHRDSHERKAVPSGPSL